MSGLIVIVVAALCFYVYFKWPDILFSTLVRIPLFKGLPKVVRDAILISKEHGVPKLYEGALYHRLRLTDDLDLMVCLDGGLLSVPVRIVPVYSFEEGEDPTNWEHKVNARVRALERAVTGDLGQAIFTRREEGLIKTLLTIINEQQKKAERENQQLKIRQERSKLRRQFEENFPK